MQFERDVASSSRDVEHARASAQRLLSEGGDEPLCEFRGAVRFARDAFDAVRVALGEGQQATLSLAFGDPIQVSRAVGVVRITTRVALVTRALVEPELARRRFRVVVGGAGPSARFHVRGAGEVHAGVRVGPSLDGANGATLHGALAVGGDDPRAGDAHDVAELERVLLCGGESHLVREAGRASLGDELDDDGEEEAAVSPALAAADDEHARSALASTSASTSSRRS